MRISVETDQSAFGFPSIDRKNPQEVMIFSHRQIRNTITQALGQIEDDKFTPEHWEDTGLLFEPGDVVKSDVAGDYVHTHDSNGVKHQIDGMYTRYIKKDRKIGKKTKKS